MGVTNLTVTINGGIFANGGAPLQNSQAYSQFLAFGDSGIDSGYFFTHPISTNALTEQRYQQVVAAGGGLPTDPGNLMNSTLLASAYGLTAIPDGMAGGTNYAASGATITGNQVNPLAPSIVQQINGYLAGHQNLADPNALYYISGGGNSIKAAQSASSNLADQQAYMVSEAHSLASALVNLSAAGAHYFVLDNLNGGSSLATTFNATLWADLEAAHVSFLVADDLALLRSINANPSSFGLTNVVQPPGGPFTSQNPYNPANGGSTLNSINSSSWSLFATQEVSPTASDTYLWADNEHLSAAGQRIEASYTANVIQNAHPVVSEVLTATSRDLGIGTLLSQSYQWQREVDGSNVWSNISGATAATYTVTTSDVGDHLRVVTTINRAGSDPASAISPSTPTVLTQIPTSGHLTFYDTKDGNNFAGGNGVDTVVYFGRHASFNVAINTDTSLSVTGPNTGVDHLSNIERLQFSDSIVAFDIQGNAGSAYRLYQAAFNRTPDTAGLSFWTHQLDLGLDIQIVAAGFVNAAEFKTVYGVNPTHAHIVDLMYQNVLGRAGESAGINFWVGQLDAGLSTGALLEGFAISSENHGIVDPKIAQGIVLDHTAFLV